MFIIIGCQDDDNPVAPAVNKYDIQITNLPKSVISPEGVSHDLIFQVSVINSTTNEVVEGAKVELAVPAGMGSISPTALTTNGHGTIEAMFSFDMPYGTTIATLFITADRQSKQATIDLIGTRRPVNIYISPSDTTISFERRGLNHEIHYSVTVSDEQGMGIAGAEVLFEVTPLNPENGDTLFGSLTPTIETDQNGVATTVFNTLGGTGNLRISCRVNEGDEFEQVRCEAALEVDFVWYDAEPGIIVNSSDNFIYADNGYTTATVRAVLRVPNNQAIANQEIIFTSDNNGAISSPIITTVTE